ncbi:MAG: PDZ domain-containing protein [Candidatus Mcinerneyibacterium aminivorans]|uniref:PDZ domain-containing protein n=1 Tax=Candidatus Mcinerneyibacterium aminivorans TaxID=2703815 RepID=A0A5D0MAZ3_9BACT|nr:MAG: PDZ domain-containing protein [Candidatus Mcinerneyibacterium aminivorans]
MYKKLFLILFVLMIITSAFPQDDSTVPFAGIRLKDTDRGPQILDIVENSPADKINLKKGDIITHINNRKIENTSEFLLKLYSFDPKERIEINYIRDNKKYSKKMILTERTDDYAYIFKNLPSLIKYYKIKLMGNLMDEKGFAAENLNKQLFEYFGVESGVIVTYVKENSIAEKRGFRAGDIITKMNDKNIKHTIDFREVYDNNKKIKFFIKRKKKNVEIELEK